ncbi:MAG: hypothetical protein GF419_05210, partial [Ignavibacteriales bacterium]|nr:hypothetical protein [Ignavibacteriales bacterium]
MGWYDNAGIRSKILLIALIPILGLAALLYFGVSGNRQLSEDFEHFVDVEQEESILLYQLHTSALQAGHALRNAILDSTDQIAYDQTLASMDEFEATLKKLRSM